MKTLRLYLTHIGYSSRRVKLKSWTKTTKSKIFFLLLVVKVSVRVSGLLLKHWHHLSLVEAHTAGQQEMNGLCTAHCGNSDVLFIVCQLIVNYFVATLASPSSQLHPYWLVLDVVNKKNRNQIDCFQRTKTKEYLNTHSSISHIPNDYNEHPYIHMVELQFSSTLAQNDWTYWGYMGTRKTNAQLIFEAKKPLKL